MGVFQRYIKKDVNGNPVLDAKGKPQREGPWFIQYPHSRDPKTGKVKYRTEKASHFKKKAMQMFREKSDAFLEADRYGIQPQKDMTFSELIDWGLSQEVMKAKVSAPDDTRNAELLKAEFGELLAAQVTPLMVDNFRIKMTRTVSEKTKKPYSGTTVNKLVTLGRRIYYLAMDGGLVTTNPFARRGAFKEEPIGQYVTDQEFRDLLEHLPEHIRPVVIVAYYTGMRRGEILRLTWDRVDLFKGVIDLTAKDTKTKEARHIYLNAIPELKEVFVEAARRRTKKRKEVFLRPEGDPVPNRYLERYMERACKKAEVGPFRFHDLRHTFNTNMVKAGVPQADVMKLTGHKTLAMFLRYHHLDREQGEAAMEKLQQHLAGGDKADGSGGENEKRAR
ncbi:Site-specific recombinase XerD [Desulfatibacillum alkenivorans DSM 16219]|jgi:integrase|uniref:Site-specific recombinase XerD n=1 Tax=Desulfatibacillum alkenivorans DSM 16219 TaxID=1121393 RepID=A0A1M6W7L9_9BACT|nr:site-specific integrase [Desulfatibacillum alkenivorans]SHK89485.1 Site-specific recombinase XerD [Desulfatibacillum alkenivorans DSM 16219]